MAIEIDYKGDAARAMQDIKDWLGEDKFNEIDGLFRQLPEPMPYRQFSMTLMLSGIQGYPLTVWHSSIWGEDAE